MSAQIHLRLYAQLNDFLPPEQRQAELILELKQPRSVKDLIESIGVPHTEVDLILANGRSVDFTYPVQLADRLSVYPVFQILDCATLIHCQPAALAEPRFVLDVHLGRLTAYLRLLGFDSLYRNDYDDPALADISASEQRILLTCDRQLLMRNQVSYGYFVRARQPRLQLLEIMSRYQLFDKQQPFTRCMHCNGLTRLVHKKDIEQQLLADTRKYYDEFYQCETCNKIYWKGSHYKKLQAVIDNLMINSPDKN